MDFLTKPQQNFCNNAGIAGLLLAITCLIQHLIFMVPHWVAYTMIVAYVITIVAYILLMKENGNAFLLLIICSATLFVLEVYMIMALVFSLVVLLLLLYTAVIAATMYGLGLPQKLIEYNKLQRAEKEKWDGVI
jgi:membrane-bound ClpP family serine protease